MKAFEIKRQMHNSKKQTIFKITRMAQQQQKIREMCCKVCKDAGKSESIFSSHWVKDNAGTVICPTLLSQSCRYCRLPGHTITHCTLVQDRNNLRNNIKSTLAVMKKEEKTQKEKVKAEKQSSSGSRFAAFIDYDDDEAVIEKPSQKPSQKPKDEYPALSEGIATMKAVSEQKERKVSFAEMVAKVTPAKVVHIAPTLEIMNKINKGETIYSLVEKEQKRVMLEKRNHDAFRGLNGLSWADMCDSDEDDDDDDNDDYSEDEYNMEQLEQQYGY